MRANRTDVLTPGKRLYVVEKGRKPSRDDPKNTATAAIGREIDFNPTVLDSFDVKGFQPIHYDLLVLCAAVEFADRRWKRPQSWSRCLDLKVPVIDIETWQKSEVLQSLQSVLSHLTGDNWQFTFVRAKNPAPVGARQTPLSLGNVNAIAIAYSDGLDSRAVSALSGTEDEVLCIRVADKRQRRKNGDSHFTQVPFKVKGHRSNESSFRSRGFQFAIVTAIAAQLSNVTRIMVPESGQGALGPVLLPLRNVYVDYRNYPTFFRKVERFVKAAQRYRVSFEQPRLWFTKGQTLRAFLALPGKTKWNLTSTRSCWQTRRIVNVERRRQCGLCAACLLRRLSLHAADIDEAPGTYVISDLSVTDLNIALSVIPQKADRAVMVEYGSVGARHLQHLADMAELPDDALRVHASELAAATGITYRESLKGVRTLLAKHAEEWSAFLSAQGEQSFLNSWMDGGRFGRSE